MWHLRDKIFVSISALLLVVAASAIYLQDQIAEHAQPKVVGSVEYMAPTLAAKQNELPPTLESSPIQLIFAGDIMLDRHIRKHAQTRGSYDFILENLTVRFNEVDAVVANLEGPVTNNPSRSLGSAVGSTNNFIFTFDPQSLVTLQKNNITIVNLGNNHILNFGLAGLGQTYEYLDQSSIDYFGNAGQGKETPNRFIITEIKGVKIGFVNYNQFVDDGLPAALSDLQAAQADSDLTIVYTHWGNEYVQENTVIKNLAHQFIDEGADLVIGTHPHVIQGIEDYKGKRIYYSLGNFIFDQYFEPAVQVGMLAHVTVDPNTLHLTFSESMVRMNRDGSTTVDSASPSGKLNY